MKTSKTTAMIILIIGIGLLAASLLADSKRSSEWPTRLRKGRKRTPVF